MTITITIQKSNYYNASSSKKDKFNTFLSACSSSEPSYIATNTKVYIDCTSLFDVISLDRLVAIKTLAVKLFGDANTSIHIKEDIV